MFAILMACMYEVDSCVRSYHVYQDTWTLLVGEELYCEREEENIHDRYAVVVKKGSARVGHVPRKVSAPCTLFLRKGGTLKCRITAVHRRYSADLPQGGLEIPCKLVFSGQDEMIVKIKKLIPDYTHLAFSSAVCVSEEQDDAQETQLQKEITFCQSHPETPQTYCDSEVVKVQEEPDAKEEKEEIILMESDSQEVMQKTPGVQVTLDHCCEAESVVPSAKKIKTDELLQFQYSKTWVKL